MYVPHLTLISIGIAFVTQAEETHGLTSSSQLWWGVRIPQIPRFLQSPQNVTIVAGDIAFLPCSIQHLGDRSVTWMRQRDLHILTVDMFTYSADNRYRVIHSDNSDDWTLQIYHVVPEDDGLYECQVNSDPKISRKVFLKVKENNQLDDPTTFVQSSEDTEFLQFKEEKPKKIKKIHERSRGRKKGPQVTIEGQPEIHMQRGSTLSLTCFVRHPSREAPDDILWFKEKESLGYDSSNRGVFIKMERKGRKSISELRISNVTVDDSGDYICHPTGMMPSAVTVHVQNGQHQAAVYQSGLSSGTSFSSFSSLILFILLLPFGLDGG